MAKKVSTRRPTIGEQVLRIRKARGLSGRELAKLAGVSDSYVSKLERGATAAPAADKVARIAMALSVPISDLTGATADAVDGLPEAVVPFVSCARAMPEKYSAAVAERLISEAKQSNRTDSLFWSSRLSSLIAEYQE